MLVYTIEALTPQHQDEWDAIIQQCPNTTAFQSLAWRDALAGAFKQLTPVYLLIKEEDSVVGGLRYRVSDYGTQCRGTYLAVSILWIS